MSSYYRNTFIGFTETSVILQFAQLRIESRHMKHTNNILLLDLLNKDFTIYSNVSRIDSKRKTDDKIEIKFLLFIIQLLIRLVICIICVTIIVISRNGTYNMFWFVTQPRPRDRPRPRGQNFRPRPRPRGSWPRPRGSWARTRPRPRGSWPR